MTSGEVAGGPGPGQRTSPFAEVVAVVALTISAAGLSISLAALLFSGDLSDGLGRATTVFLIGAGINTIMVAARRTVPGAVACSQDGPAIVMLAVIANLAAATQLTATGALVTVAVSSAMAGVAMILLGHFSGGNIVRFMPAVVINAFVAGTGVLLFRGGLEVMADTTIGVDTFTSLFQTSTLKFWLPGLVLGLVMHLLSASPRVPNGSSAAAIVVATVGFYLVVATASSVQTAEADGWLVGPFTAKPSVSLITPAELADTPWTDVGGQATGLAAAAAVAALAVMLNLSGLESITGRRFDLDGELKANGLANLIQSTLGSTSTGPGLGFTTLANRMGATTPRIGFAVGTLVAGFGVLGVSAIGYVPRFVVGGLLVAVAVGLFANWVKEMRSTINPSDWVVSTIIIACIAAVGVLEGILVGIIIACGVFIVRYSRVSPIRRQLLGTATRSQVDRSAAEVEQLIQHGQRTRIFELQGFLFFGSMTGMAQQVRHECGGDADTGPGDHIDHVVFDLRHVTGIDSSALGLLRTLIDDLTGDGIEVIVSSTPPAATTALTSELDPVTVHPTLDEAIAHIEDRILAGRESASTRPRLPDSVLDRFDRTTVPAGTHLTTTGEPADHMSYMISGTASAYAVDDGSNGGKGGRFRLRRFTAPGWIGEIGFLQHAERTADVVAETDIELVTITRDTFDAIRNEHPDLIITLLDNIATDQARRAQTLSTALTQAAGGAGNNGERRPNKPDQRNDPSDPS